MPSLILESGDSIDLTTVEPLIIGREGDECNILIPDGSISRNHAKIGVSKDGQYYIGDMGSTNGTHINGEKLPPNKFFFLEEGDEIKFGNVKTKYSAARNVQSNLQQNIQNPSEFQNQQLQNQFAQTQDQAPALNNSQTPIQEGFNTQAPIQQMENQAQQYSQEANFVQTQTSEIPTHNSINPEQQFQQSNQQSIPQENQQANTQNYERISSNPKTTPKRPKLPTIAGIDIETIIDKVHNLTKMFTKK